MSLEKNIERIADALEAIAQAAGAKTDAADGKGSAAVPPMTPPAGPVPGQTAAPAGGQVPLSGTAQAGSPVPLSGMPQAGGQWPGYGGSPSQFPSQAGMPQMQTAPPAQPAPTPGTVPTTAAPRQYTFDQLAVATANLSASGKDVFSILGRFGANMLMDLPQEKYGEYAAALREAGAVI